MDKEINEMAITPDKPINVKAPTRKEAGEKIAEIRKQAAEQGLTEQPGGFISATGDGFTAILKFTKK